VVDVKYNFSRDLPTVMCVKVLLKAAGAATIQKSGVTTVFRFQPTKFRKRCSRKREKAQDNNLTCIFLDWTLQAERQVIVAHRLNFGNIIVPRLL
jgi:hypothetical protein